MSKKTYYVAMVPGKKPEIVTSWEECQKKISGVSKASCVSFNDESEAKDFINDSRGEISLSEEAKAGKNYYVVIHPEAEYEEGGGKWVKKFSSDEECKEYMKEYKKEVRAKKEEIKDKKDEANRLIHHGFENESDVDNFIKGIWREPLKGKAKEWLDHYRAEEIKLEPDTDLDAEVDAPKLFDAAFRYVDDSYDGAIAYVDGSHKKVDAIERYGFGVVFMYNQKIEKFYGGGADPELIKSRQIPGELLSCMEAIKYAEARGVSRLTIIYDWEGIREAYYGCGKHMLMKAAGWYIHEMREKMEIKVKCIRKIYEEAEGEIKIDYSHSHGGDPGNALADKLAEKGVGL